MKSKLSLISMILIILVVINSYAQQEKLLLQKRPYLDQKPPGLTPTIFAPEIVSTKHRVYANVNFNPGLTEVCWTPNSADTTFWHGGILFSKKNNGVWSEPKEIRFLSEGYNHRSPYFGLNGKRLYFQGYQAIHQGWDQKEKFYFVEKTSQGWSEPTLLDSIFNKYAVHWQFSLDSENNFYFGGDLRGVENSGGIYCSKFVNGKYWEPELIFSNQQYGEAVFGPAISPDGGYILFARVHPRGSTNPRIFSIYISFQEGEDGWTKPQELGEKLNMDGNQPRLSPDGKYIFFVGNDSQSYWVDAKIIEGLKPINEQKGYYYEASKSDNCTCDNNYDCFLSAKPKNGYGNL